MGVGVGTRIGRARIIEGWRQRCERVYHCRTFFFIICCISFLIYRAIGHVVVEISLVYFSSAKAGYVSEIPVMSDIPVHDVRYLWSRTPYLVA